MVDNNDVNTPAKIVDVELTEQHRKLFNLQAFGIGVKTYSKGGRLDRVSSSHEAHTSYQASRVQLIHCPHPNTSPEESECRDLRKGTEVIVSVLHDVEVLANTITVHDGLKRPMQRWHNHIVNILKRCKLIDRETEFIWSKKGGDYIDSYDLLPKRDRAHGGENHDDQDQQWYCCVETRLMDEETRKVTLVVCGTGLICATDQLKDYWIPFDGYSVRATADEECPLPNAMNEVRRSIISGDFCLEKCARITIHKAHQEVIGASSPCLKKRCSCKGGRCKGNCGCRRSSRTLIVNIKDVKICTYQT
eukprot:scaffold13538_cov72-Cyclotella_meneghiniana.AAC.3